MSSPANRDAPAFDFYPERWLVGTAAMSDLEQIAYLRLLCHQWLAGDVGLPDDVGTLRRLGGKGCTAAVLAKFPTGKDGALRNARLEVVRGEQRERIRKKSEQRRAAAMKRWNADEGGAVGVEVSAGAAVSKGGEMRHRKTSNKDAVAMRSHTPRIAAGDAGEMRSFCDSNAHHPPPTTDIKRESIARERADPWPRLEEVVAYAETVLAPVDCAERFWNDCESSGWTNRHGQVIRDWRPLFRNFATVWKANAARQARAEESQKRQGSLRYGKPRYVAYNAEEVTKGLTAEEISNF
jgi:uncharacterized protein YdaU (DUF1376 family)